jgi:hypothetical protein
MDTIEHYIYKNIKRIVNKIQNHKTLVYDHIDNYDIASNTIIQYINAAQPLMIARLGAFESNVISNYIGIKKGKNISNYITGKQDQWWWNRELLQYFSSNAGFFPLEEKLVEQYCKLSLNDMKEVDILATWQPKEIFFTDYLKPKVRISLPSLEPFWSNTPWTKSLEGKKIVIVHPFAETIQKQYQIRSKLFENKDVLPNFKLRIVKAVQSIGGQCTQFQNWFDALHYMQDEISKEDYDICLIGCGAYGFSLAAYVKRCGKQAIHMGGALQLLFGIKGKRWDGKGQSQFYNEYWCQPIEKTNNYKNIENGCYW